MVLQGLGYLVEACSIGEGLHHAYRLRCGLHHAAVVVEVSHHGIEVDFERGFVHLQCEPIGNAVKAKAPRSFDEHQ